jgi:hypothetical protein
MHQIDLLNSKTMSEPSIVAHATLTVPQSFTSFVAPSVSVSAPKQVVFDGVSNSLILRVGSRVVRVDATCSDSAGRTVTPDMSKATICGFSESESVAGWCVSPPPAAAWFAYRRREHEVELQSADGQVRFAQPCRRAPAVAVLGHFFLFDASAAAARKAGGGDVPTVLVMVTGAGLELYQFPPVRAANGKPTLKLQKELKFATRSFVYSAQLGTLLLLGVGREQYNVQAIQFDGTTGVTRLPQFELAPPAQGSDPSTCHVHLMRLYGRIYCIHADTTRSRLNMLQLTEDAVLRRGKITVPFPNVGAHVHTCDNLLLVHAEQAKVCFIYDVKEHDQSFPVAPALPLDDTHCKAPFALYAPHWQFLQPDIVLDAVNGRMWRVGVRASAVASTLTRQKPRQIDFLLRRAGAKQHLLGLLRNALAERTSLAQLALIFDMLNTILGRAVQQGLYDKSRSVRRTSVAPIAAAAPPSPQSSLKFGQGSSANLAALDSSNGSEPLSPRGASSANTAAAAAAAATAAAAAVAAEAVELSQEQEQNISLAELEQRYAALREERYLSPTEHAILRRQIDEARRRELRKLELSDAVATAATTTTTTTTTVAAESAVASPAAAPAPAQSGVAVSLSTPPPATDDTAAMRGAEGYAILDQVDLYTHLFVPAAEAGLPFKYEISVLTDYLRSLHAHDVQPAPFLYELLVNLFVKRGRFHQLHQYLQYHAIDDSVHVACQLLSLESVYPPASQLALDMLSRLATKSTREQIIDVLLAHKQVVGALRFGFKFPSLALPVRRFLEVAVELNDHSLFHHLVRHLSQRNLLTNEHKQFVALFKQRFTLPVGAPLPASF